MNTWKAKGSLVNGMVELWTDDGVCIGRGKTLAECKSHRVFANAVEINGSQPEIYLTDALFMHELNNGVQHER